MTLAEAIRTLRTNVRMFPNLALATVIIYAATATEIGVMVGVRTKSIILGVVAGDVISALAVVATFALFMLIASSPTLYARCQRLADRFVNDYPVSIPENDDEQVSVADYDRGYDSGSDDYEYVAGEEEQEPELDNESAERYADSVAPLGCTCKNSNDYCEWCEAKYGFGRA